jgi:TRAP-type C4-dicarboxylate transport system substrate-binding protein
MMRSITAAFCLALTFGLVAVASPTAQAQEVELRVVTGLPKQLVFAARFLAWVEKVNKEGKGIVQFKYLGGPEAIPPAQQATAVRNGVVDAQFGPPAYYLGQAPEADALFGSNVKPAEARANGGLEMLDKVWRAKLNAHLLGWFSGSKFGLYTRDEPKLDAKTGIRLDGLKMRSNAVYKDLFDTLGAINVSINVPDLYTALERNVVQGFAFPFVGVMDFGWDKFVRYRIEPYFWQDDLIVIVNADKWDKLPQKARDFLTKSAADWEVSGYGYWNELNVKENAELTKRGVKLMRLEGDYAKVYVANAHRFPWERVEKASPKLAPELKAKFYKP